MLTISLLAATLAGSATTPHMDDELFHSGRVTTDGGHTTEYRWLAPPKVEEGERYPLILFLHGAGERGDDNAKQLTHFPTRMAEPARREQLPCFVLAPQCPQDDRWTTDPWGSKESRPLPAEQTAAMQGAIAALVEFVHAHPVDTDRIYLTGLSMGGYGSFELAMRHPDWFAAVAAVCGGGDEREAARLAGLPLSVWHGDADRAVPVERSRQMVAALRELGEEPRYHELAGVGHAAWTPAYGADGCLEWMFEQRRDPMRRMRAAARVMADAVRDDERIAFLGDSITEAGAKEDGYVRLIADVLRTRKPDAEVVPAGISGHKVPNLLAREERDVRAKGATLVFLYIGINDVWHSKDGRGTDRDVYERGLGELLERFHGSGAAVALSTPSVIGEKREGANEFDAMLGDYAGISKRIGERAESSLDLHRAFFDHLRIFGDGESSSGVLTTDGVHLNEAGNVFVATEAAHAIRRAALARDAEARSGR